MTSQDVPISSESAVQRELVRESSFDLSQSIIIPSQFSQITDAETDNHSTPCYSAKSVASELTTSETSSEFKVHNLLCSADKFIDVAHNNSKNVHLSEENLLQYNKLIKAAITCLLLATKKYRQTMSVEQQVTVYLRLAKLYFCETMNTELAEEAVNKAISIATRSNLLRLKFQAEYLAVEILFSGSPKLGMKYLSNKIEEYSHDEVFNSFVTLLKLLELKYTMALDPSYAYPLIKALTQSQIPDTLTRQLILFYHISFLLYSGDLEKLATIITELESSIEAGSLPQFKSILYFYKLWKAVMQSDFNSAKLCISQLDLFLKEEKANNWTLWNEDGTFVIKVPVDYTQLGFEKESMQMEFSYTVEWLSATECSFMLYFISGIAYLPKSFDGKDKSLKFFEACSALINNQQLQLLHSSASLSQYENSRLKLHLLKIYLNYYEILSRFNSSQWEIHPEGKDKILFDFINQYDEGQLSSQEIMVYHKLFPHILYLFGAYYHGKQDLEAAKLYYNRLRSHLSRSTFELPSESRFTTDPILLSSFQISLGLGGDTLENRSCSSELYILASLNLLIILSFEVKNSSEEEIFMQKSSFKKDILAQLFTTLDDKNYEGILISDTILNITVQLFKIIYDTSSLSETKETMNTKENVQVLSSIMTSSNLIGMITSNFPVLAALLFYISSYLVSDSMVKLKNLQTSYHYAKLSKNFKLLSLCSYHIYKVMVENDGDVFSVEEINDQKLKYLNYFEMFNKKFGFQIQLPVVANEPPSEGGQFDNEKNDNYYDDTVADLTSQL